MYRVLIADDEPIERLVVSKIINKHFSGQLEVVQAVNGREAVMLFEKERCHIALLDIEMPGINGLEAAQQIRNMRRDCSIIFLTAFDEFSYAKKAITVRALDYLLKPGSEEKLVAVLEEAVRLAMEAEAGKERWKTTEMLEMAEYGCREAGGKISGTDNIEDDRNHCQGFGEEAGGQEADVCREREEREKSSERLRMNVVTNNIRTYMEEHYCEDIALQDVAAEMNYSDAYFCKLFKQCFDRSFVTYLTSLRIERAKEMLEDVAVNIKDISCRVGYRDSNYFAKVFKRMAGVTPSEYRSLKLREKDKAE